MDSLNSRWPRRLTRRALFRRAGLLAGATAAASLAAACGSRGRPSAGSATAPPSRPTRGGTLRLRVATDIITLDPAFSQDVISSFVISNCVEPLVTVDQHAQPTGLLVTRWENPDEQTYIFHLRRGVTFRDGTPLNADAVAYSLNRVRTDKTTPHYADLAAIASIETPDPATVKMSLNAPFAPFLYKLTDNEGRVISPAAAEKLKGKLKTDLTGAGTGPFTFVEWRPDDHATFARNAQYWGHDATGLALPYVDSVTVRPISDSTAALASLRTGEIDGFRPNGSEAPPPKDTASVLANLALSLESAPGTAYGYIVFNEAREPFNQKALRQAISYAIDRQSIASTVLFNTVEPLDVIFASSTWAADPGYHPYLKQDIAKAKQLLAQAGQPNGFSFTYTMAAGNQVIQQIAELIQDQLGSAGITMTIQALDFATLTQTLSNGQHQAGYLAWSAGYDPDDWVYTHFSSKGALNARSHYSNATVDRLLDQARTTLDIKQRASLYQQAQRQIIDDAAFCVLYLSKNWSLSTSKVHNDPIGPTPAVGVSQVWKTA